MSFFFCFVFVFFLLIFFVDEGRKDSDTTISMISGSLSTRRRNAI